VFRAYRYCQQVARRIRATIGGKNIFTFSDAGCMKVWGHVPDDPPRVLFGHAGDPDSLESATVKAAWLDECGQKGFRLGSYEAILGRLSIHRGRLLLTSRPYDLGWMKQLLHDPWEAAKKNHPRSNALPAASPSSRCTPTSCRATSGTPAAGCCVRFPILIRSYCIPRI
jgi:hypothetical protein